MAQIYISSTFEDLKDYRDAVYKALRKLRHDVVAMEDYVATDKRPLDKCLTDVESCDVYVGIFAWRYGYVPKKDNPQKQSITEREFRHAVEKDKPCLIFLLAEDEPWPPRLMENGRGARQIKSLRKELGENATASFFRDSNELAQLVVTAVTRWRDERPEPSPPLKPLGPGALLNVPDLPPHFLPRPEDIAALKQAVLAPTNQPVVVTGTIQKIGVHGMGGIGKSVLATALARDDEVRRAFPDGVLWLTVGQNPPSLTGLQLQLARMLGDSPPAFEDIQQGRAHLSKLFAERACLVIVDDLWDAEHAKAFDALGSRCQMLVTTRDGTLITALGAVEHRVDILSEAQARLLLAEWTGRTVASLPVQADEVVRQCGRLPLALALSAAQIRDGVSWQDLVGALQAADLAFLDHSHVSIMKSLKVSIDALSPDDARRYLALAVFPADEAIPEATVLTLWGHANGASERTLRKLLAMFERKALVRVDGESPSRKVSLHDLQYDYLRAITTDLSSLHTELLAAYQARCINGWASGPNDGYFFQRLASHLIGADRRDELRDLLYDFPWLQAKLDATDINAVLVDYDLLPDDTELRLVQGALRLSAHVLAYDPAQLRSQLYARLLTFSEPKLQHLREQAGRAADAPWIRSLQQTITPPGGPLLRTLAGHSSGVTAATVTPDGRYIISGSADQTLKVWELASGREVRTLAGHGSGICAVTVTPDPDGRYVISGSYDQTLKMWELASGRELHTMKGHARWVRAITITSDGRYAISGSGDWSLKVWDLANGQEVCTFEGHSAEVTSVVVTPDGLHVISASRDQTLKMWELKSGQAVHTLRWHHHWVTAATITPDGYYIIFGFTDNTLRMWELANWRELRVLEGHRGSVTAVTVTPNGRYIISGASDDTLKVWKLESGQAVQTLEGHSDSITAVVVTPDGHRVISGSDDHTLNVWELERGREVSVLEGHSNRVTAIIVTPDGRYVITGSDDNTLKVWGLKSRREVRTLTGHSDSVTAITVTLDSRFVVSGSRDLTLKVWDLDSGREVRMLKGHHHSVTAVAVTPDGHHVISGSEDHTLRVWELNSEREVRTLNDHHGWVTAVAVTPNGRFIISGSGSDMLKVWELSSGREVLTLEGHNNSISTVVVTLDGYHIISGSWDGTLKVWELSSGQEVRTLEGHGDEVNTVTVTPDGCYAISGSDDRSLKVWELLSGREITTFTVESPILCCAVAPDGRTIVVGDSSGRVHFLRLEGVGE